MAFQLQYSSVCVNCDGVLGQGEWGEYADGGLRHERCPRQPTVCMECFLQHNGECI